MKPIQLTSFVLSLISCTVSLNFCSNFGHSGEGITEYNNKVGYVGDISYEIWADGGNNNATFYSDGSFSCNFNKSKDFSCCTGFSLDGSKKHNQIGNIYADFKFVKKDVSNADYSYMGVYGWTKSPLVEFYIVDSWIDGSSNDWVSARKVGNINVNGDTYIVYENTSTTESIDGHITFKQYFSVRTSIRNCGSIDVTEHFIQWEKFGLHIGNLYEVNIIAKVGSDRSTTSGLIDFPYAKVYTGFVNSSSGNIGHSMESKNDDQMVKRSYNQLINRSNTNIANDVIHYTYDNITKCNKKDNFIYIYDKKKVLNKEKVLNTINVFQTSYYCKNDICVLVDNEYSKPFIEIPDKNGNILLYNTYTCTYDNAKSNNCSNDKRIDNLCLSVKCTNNSQCLSNECINNYCIFNDEEPIVHCDNIYIGSESTYMNCGKAYNDTCQFNDDCSSKICRNNICTKQTYIPSKEGINMNVLFYSFLIIAIILLIIIIICGISYFKYPKSRKYIKIIFILFIVLIIIFIIYRIIINN